MTVQAVVALTASGNLSDIKTTAIDRHGELTLGAHCSHTCRLM